MAIFALMAETATRYAANDAAESQKAGGQKIPAINGMSSDNTNANGMERRGSSG